MTVPLIYIAGPISNGPLAANVRAACDAGMALMRAGLCVIVPHLTCFMGMRASTDAFARTDGAFFPEILPCDTDYEFLITHCLNTITHCDAVLRLPGLSPGADREVLAARRIGLPVFVAADDCIRHYRQSGRVA